MGGVVGQGCVCGDQGGGRSLGMVGGRGEDSQGLTKCEGWGVRSVLCISEGKAFTNSRGASMWGAGGGVIVT